ncbi:MAG: hypothetical protein H7Y05_01260 [Steroidobacteraceae bacterium]|nr:hypothetical protein [Deltaproteobacteria bacterium]
MLAAGLLLLMPSASSAADLHVTSDTIMRGFDRQTANGKKLAAVPAYEYLQLDYGNLKSTGLSLHANGWGRLNLGDNYNDGNNTGELLHAYLQYVSPGRDVLVRAGRQYVFEGVARDNIDGIYAKTDLVPAVVLSAYAGSPVTLDSSNGRKDDLILGGKISHSRPGLYDLGASYKYVADNGRRDEESIGTDLTLLFPGAAYLLGHSAYNLVSGGWKEHSYELRLPLKQFTIQPFFQYFSYADFFNNRNNSANPFRFLQGSDNSLTVAGTEAFWYPSEHQEYVLRFKNYDYDKRFSNSQLYSLLAIWKWKILSEVGAEFGRMQGNDAENSYYLGRGYFFWNISPGFITADLMYVNYDKAIYAKNSSLFTSVGGGTKFFNDALSLKLSFDYSNDPYFDADYRWMLKLNYVLDKTFAGAVRKN